MFSVPSERSVER